MPVKIIKHESQSEPVKIELIISTIEMNRDRIRTLANMLITLTGILIPACLAFLLFFADKGLDDFEVALSLIISLILFLVASCLSITASFLRNRFVIQDEVQFIEDLLSLLNSELRIAYISFTCLLAGMLLMILGVIIFVVKHWS